MQGIRLDQHAFQLQGAQQLFEGSPFTGFAGVVGRLGQGDAESTGIDRDLGDEPMAAVFRLHCRAAQRLAIAHQLVQTLSSARDLADHPGLEHLAEFLQVGLIEQVKEGGIRRPALEIEAQGLVQRLTMPPGKGLEITGAAAAAQNPQHRHQQQEPLRVAHPTAVAAIGDGLLLRRSLRLEEVDQVIRCGLINCGGAGFGHWER